MQRQGIDNRGQHTGGIGGGAIHAGRFVIGAAPDVPAPDNDGDLRAKLKRGVDFVCDKPEDLWVKPELAVAFERLAAYL